MYAKLLSDIEIYPEVIQLVKFYFDKIKGRFKGDEFISAVLGSGYSLFNDEQRKQFIQKMEDLGEDMSWIPYRIQAEKEDRYETRKRAEEDNKNTKKKEKDGIVYIHNSSDRIKKFWENLSEDEKGGVSIDAYISHS